MADIESPDRVGVKVWPDTRRFLKDLRATLKRVEKQVKLNVPIAADGERLLRETRESVKAAGKAAGKIEVPAALEDGFLAKMQRDLKAATASVEAEIPLTADGERLRRETRGHVEALREQLRAMALEVPLDVEMAATQRAELAAGIAALQAQAHANPVEVPVQVSGLSRLGAQIRGVVDGSSVRRRRGLAGLITSLVGGLGRLALSVPVNLFDAFGDSLKVFQSTLSDATSAVADGGKDMGKFAGVAFAGARAVGALVGSLGGVIGGVGAIVLLTGAIGGTASAISLLTGMLTVFVGTLGTAIIAPLLAVIPMLGAFGAGALVAAGGIAMWAKESKEVKKFLPPIKEELKGLADQIGPTLDGLTRLFGSATVSLIRDFGGSVKAVFDDLYSKLDAPSMDKFYDQWSVKMPSIFEQLGKSISSFTTGLTAFFTPILPYAERLAMSIRSGADRFNEWAQSASGQNAVADWMREAWEIASDLWSGLKDISGAIGDVMAIGVDESGGQFAQWVRDIGDDFRKWTESEQGRKDIKQWFQDAEELAGDVRVIIANIGEAFDRLDSPAGRAMLDDFMGFLKFTSTVGVHTASAIDMVNRSVQDLSGWLNSINADKGILDLSAWSEEIEIWKGRWESFKVWLSNVDWSSVGRSVIEGILKGLGLEAFTGQIQTAMSAIGDAIVNFFKLRLGIASPSQVMYAVTLEVGAGILQALLAIPGMIGGAVMAIGSTIVGGVRSGLGRVGAVLATFPGRVMGALSVLGGLLAAWGSSAWGRARTVFSGGVSGTVGFFAGVPGRILGAVGSLAGRLGSWAGIAWSRATSAFASGVSATVSFIGSVPGRVIGAVSSLGGRLASWAGSAWSMARSGTGIGIGSVVSLVGTLPGRIIGAIGHLGGQLYSIGASMIGSLASGMVSMLGAVASAAAAAAQRVRDRFPGSPVKEGPLTSWNYGGGTTGAGRRLIGDLAKGMEAERSSVVASSRLIASAALPAAAPSMASGSAGGRGGAGDLEAAITRAFAGVTIETNIDGRTFNGVMKRVNQNRRGR